MDIIDESYGYTDEFLFEWLFLFSLVFFSLVETCFKEELMNGLASIFIQRTLAGHLSARNHISF